MSTLKRLKPVDSLRSISWPDTEKRRSADGLLFAPRYQYRRIRVMADADLLDAPGAPSGQVELLGQMVRSPLVDLIRFADEGPPADLVPELLPGGQKLHPGWAVVDPYVGGWGVTLQPPGGGWCMSGVIGNAVEVAEADQRTNAYQDLSAVEAALRRRSDALAAQVASQGLHADIYITDREYLHSVTWDVARETAICTVAEALALLGLYFRSQGEYVVSDGVRYNRGLYTWVGARELVPEWRPAEWWAIPAAVSVA